MTIIEQAKVKVLETMEEDRRGDYGPDDEDKERSHRLLVGSTTSIAHLAIMLGMLGWTSEEILGHLPEEG